MTDTSLLLRSLKPTVTENLLAGVMHIDFFVEQALKDGSGSVTELLAELKIRLDKAIDEAQEFLDQQQNGG